MSKEDKDRVQEKKQGDLDIGENLDKEMVNMPQIYNEWAELSAEMSSHVKELKDMFDIWLAKKKAEVDEEEVKKGGKKLGQEAKLDAVFIRFEKEYMDKRREIIKAEENQEKLYETLKSLKIKSDMLIQLGANIRSEMGMTGMGVKKGSEFNAHVGKKSE